MNETLKGILSTVAPVAAGLLGGPLAATAVQALSQKFLGKVDGTLDELTPVLTSGNPEVLLKLKEVDKELKTTIINAGIKLEEIGAADRASARNLAITTGIRPQVLLTVLFVAGYFLVLIMVLSGYIKVPLEWKEFAISLISVITASVLQIMNFWFGTSKGSADKNVMLADKLTA